MCVSCVYFVNPYSRKNIKYIKLLNIRKNKNVKYSILLNKINYQKILNILNYWIKLKESKQKIY